MNDLQLYSIYLSIDLPTINTFNECVIYPKYVVITGRSMTSPHPCRHYSFLEFIDALYKYPEFRKVIFK